MNHVHKFNCPGCAKTIDVFMDRTSDGALMCITSECRNCGREITEVELNAIEEEAEFTDDSGVEIEGDDNE